MATEAQTLAPARRARAWMWAAAPLAMYAVSVAVTEPAFVGDTPFYAEHVLQVHAGERPLSSLWEFGHILWRPLAYALMPVFFSIVPAATPLLKVVHGLTWINLISGALAIVLIYDLSRRLMGSPLAALAPAAIFVWADSVLAYSQSGACYIPAVALLVAGLWWELVYADRGYWSLFGPAVLFGLTALLWFPFVLVIPAAVCARRWIRLPGRAGEVPSWISVFAAAVVSGVVVVAGVGGAALLAGIGSFAEFRSWVNAAGHEWSQNRQWMRAVSGCARLLIELGRDGVYLKRFALKDPYNPVSAASLVTQSLWKLALFYVFVGAVGTMAALDRKARPALATLLLAGAPAMFFAIFLFEPSSPERFLPVLPFLLLALAAGWNGRGRAASAARAVVVLFSLLLPFVNWPSFAGAHSPEKQRARAQLSDFRNHARPDDVLLSVTPGEPVIRMLMNPYEAAGEVRYAYAINVAEARVAEWRSHVAQLVLDTWKRGVDVWVIRTALDDRPDPRSLWVEGDNPQIRWKDVPAFFRQLPFDAQTSLPDGFVRIRRGPEIEARLADIAHSSAERPGRRASGRPDARKFRCGSRWNKVSAVNVWKQHDGRGWRES